MTKLLLNCKLQEGKMAKVSSLAHGSIRCILKDWGSLMFNMLIYKKTVYQHTTGPQNQ